MLQSLWYFPASLLLLAPWVLAVSDDVIMKALDVSPEQKALQHSLKSVDKILAATRKAVLLIN